MSLKLRQKKDLVGRFQRIALTLVENAENTLSRSTSNRGKRIHNARKGFKQLRGLLRLIRYELGDEIYSRENTSLRDAGRPLSAVRDADVMIETFDNLVRYYKGQIKKSSFKKLRSKLIQRKTKIVKQIVEKQKAMEKSLDFIKQIRSDIKQWPKTSNQFTNLQKGIRKIYARGQKEMDIALKDPTVENLHEWRKSVKYLRYQLEFLESLHKKFIGEMAKQAHELSDILGLDHDLAVLHELFHTELKNDGTPEEREVLFALIQKRRSELFKEAEGIGPHLYGETPKQFSKRVKGYWKKWTPGAKKAA